MNPGAHQEFLGIPAVLASPEILEVIERARRVAQTSMAVLITGETGSGKEIVARAIHHFSLRCSKPWVDVNCGAFPEQLMESELFGHEKGAFSGADSAKPGLFEMANGGSLFLDEVGELDPRMQVKLLRVLDGVPYYRLGGQKKVSLDVRVIAATNQDLEQRIAHGRFRSDLYHRLNHYRIRVPPLRDRREDIVPLARHFLRQHSPKAYFCEAAEEILRRHSWPGNVRELRNAVSHGVVTARSYEIGPGDLPVPERPIPFAARITEAGDLRLDDVERQTILDTLERTGGHHERAAALLGISRRTLSRKLKLYRMQSYEASEVS
jgi:DNA-binding NtrC family response regulator